jgi:hypothetical protein
MLKKSLNLTSFGALYTPDFIEGCFDGVVYLYEYKWCHAYIATEGHAKKIYSRQ